jgi:hypothetical protein
VGLYVKQCFVLLRMQVREVVERVADALKSTAAGSSSGTAAAAAAAEATTATATTADGETVTTTVATAAAAVEVPTADTAEPAAVAVRATTTAVATTSRTAAAAADKTPPAAAAAAGAVLAPPINAADEPAGALESFEDTGEAAEVAAAAAAGQFVDVVLYAPGRLLYVRPVDESVDEEQQRFELVDGKGGEVIHFIQCTPVVLLLAGLQCTHCL